MRQGAEGAEALEGPVAVVGAKDVEGLVAGRLAGCVAACVAALLSAGWVVVRRAPSRTWANTTFCGWVKRRSNSRKGRARTAPSAITHIRS